MYSVGVHVILIQEFGHGFLLTLRQSVDALTRSIAKSRLKRYRKTQEKAMSKMMIVLDKMEDWDPYAKGPEVITAPDYLTGNTNNSANARIINLCSGGEYLSSGYYVSLLTEARGHRAIPSVRTLLELNDPNHAVENIFLKKGTSLRNEIFEDQITIYFGQTPDKRLASLAASIFSRYPAPILNAVLDSSSHTIRLKNLKLQGLQSLSETEESLFADSLDRFSSRIWRRASDKSKKYDLAILVDPNDPTPPSSRGAIRYFEKAARQIGFEPEIITPEDKHRLLEFDALLIRSTTAINHYTYKMAVKASREGMAVIDSPDSILRCGNKVYLHDILSRHQVTVPNARILLRDTRINYREMIEELDLPIVLKIPDGSFSLGGYRVESMEELKKKTEELLQSSAAIIAQSFISTEFDWRIGVLEGRALFACKYHMAPNHWQIINHNHSKASDRFGRHESIPLSKVPGKVVRMAVKASRLISDGFYGVDLKEHKGQAMVIEVNDNPNVDNGVEDEILGEELYRQIISHMMIRVQQRGKIV